MMTMNFDANTALSIVVDAKLSLSGVFLCVVGGSFQFARSLTPSDARKLAHALTCAADQIEIGLATTGNELKA